MKKIIVQLLLVATVMSFVFNSYAAKTVTGVANINTATAQELVLVPGIGEAKAKAIVEFRSKKTVTKKSELLAIKGIGEKLLAKISNYLVLNGKTTIAVAKAKK